MDAGDDDAPLEPRDSARERTLQASPEYRIPLGVLVLPTAFGGAVIASHGGGTVGHLLHEPLAIGTVVLVVTDAVGGVLAVRIGLNSWDDAWGSSAVLAAPAPMILGQVLLAWLALRLTGRKAALPAGLLALACLVSVASGFFDGGLTHSGLTTGTRLFQAWLLTVTGAVGALAARHAWRALRLTGPARRGGHAVH